MEGDHIKINEWLTPLSWLYGIGTALRNALYNMGILRSYAYDIPIIDVGNITVGGTGKTPHIEYLVRLLSPYYQVAILSRGYKRKSRGYILAKPDTPMHEIGDEPWQMKQKFPDIHVAVDADRCRGIRRLCTDQETSNVQVILLDDAFQYRRVRAGLNILLIDYHRMITDDRLLPAGHLREKAEGKDRADIVIITKCPPNITPMGYRVIQSALRLKPFQDLFYSSVHYGQLTHIDHGEKIRLEDLRNQDMHILLLSGIGNPLQMEQDMHRYAQHITPLAFSDHHYFSTEDLTLIKQTYGSMSEPKIIITTEKDASRLRHIPHIPPSLRENIYVLPIHVEFMRNESKTFNLKIKDYVRHHSRNSKLAQGKNA
ncbi:MAG: tetraacyldisaccharide 4'-kinase [Bacteroidaceae bacterium]